MSDRFYFDPDYMDNARAGIQDTRKEENQVINDLKRVKSSLYNCYDSKNLDVITQKIATISDNVNTGVRNHNISCMDLELEANAIRKIVHNHVTQKDIIKDTFKK